MEKCEIKSKTVTLISDLFSGLNISRELLEHCDLIDDLGMNSMSFISLIVDLEAEFDIEIPDDWLDMEKFRSCSLIVSAVEYLISEKDAGIQK